MSDILSRKELEHGEDAPGWRLCHYSPAEYQRTALWLAEKGRLAAMLNGDISCCDCPRYATCPVPNTGTAECVVAAKELLEWWGK